MSTGSSCGPCSMWNPTHFTSVSSKVKLIHKEYPRFLFTLFCLVDEPQRPPYSASNMEIDIYETPVEKVPWQRSHPSLHNSGYNDIRVSFAIWLDLFHLHCALWDQEYGCRSVYSSVGTSRSESLSSFQKAAHINNKSKVYFSYDHHTTCCKRTSLG